MISENQDAKQLSRLVVYPFLALSFYEPSVRLVETLDSEESAFDFVQAVNEVLGPEGEREARGMLDAYLQAALDPNQAMVDLKVEYNRLFVGPAAPVCPPYQSVYDKTRPTIEQGTMLGPTAEAVATAMRQEGLGVVLDHAELPDHAAIILEFMFYLLSRAQDTENGAEYAKRADAFRSQHIAPWLAEFGANVAKSAEHPFYAHAGRLLALFATSEAR